MQVAHSQIARTPLDLLPNAIQKAHPTAPFRTEPTFPWDGTNTLSKQRDSTRLLCLAPRSRKEKHQRTIETPDLGACTLLSTSPGRNMLDMARCFFRPSAVKKSTFQFRTESQAGLLKISLPFLLHPKSCLLRNSWEN